MHKKGALNAGRYLLYIMEKRRQVSNAIAVYSVIRHLSGKLGITVSTGANTGSGSGLPRAIQSGGCVSFLTTVPPHLMALRITGLNKYPRNKSTMPGFSTWFTMRLIFIRMGVS
jgi:hypothetical protein